MLKSLSFFLRGPHVLSSRVIRPLPRIPQFARSFLTSQRVLKENHNGRDKWTTGLRDLLKPVEHYLEHGHDGLAASHFLKGLKTLKPGNTQLFRIYEYTISLFLRHKHVLSAAIIYSHMRAQGFIPSVSLRTQMHVIKLAMEVLPDEFTLLGELKDVFQQKFFLEDDLRDLLNLLVNSMGCDPEFIDKVVRTFLGTRKPDYKLRPATISLLVRIHTQAGSVAIAQEWIADHSSSSSQPYTDLLHTLISTDPENKDAYRWVVEHMKANKIEADLAFYNVTLALWASHERASPVFEVYDKLRKSERLSLVPDAYTYCILFSLLQEFRWDRREGRRVKRRVPLPHNAPSTRVLFHQMIECHLKYTGGDLFRPSRVLTPDVLDDALRLFMTEEDWAAASVIMRVRRMFNFNPQLSTFHIVITRLLSRIQRELKLIPKCEEPDRYWTYQFLGLEGYHGDLPNQWDAFAIMLRIAKASPVNLDYPSAQDPSEVEQGGAREEDKDKENEDDEDERKGPTQDKTSGTDTKTERLNREQRYEFMPSTSVFLKNEPPDPNVVWQFAPLQRILRRAMLAESPGIDNQGVTEKIEQASREMLPVLPEISVRRNSRSSRSEGAT